MADWDDLRVLLCVSESGSASAAARKLGVDKATVVRRVGRLEQELGARLLVRRASGWTPTPAGARAAAAAKDMQRSANALSSELAERHGTPRTTVLVTAPHWFSSEVLLPALPKLLEEAPWLDVVVAATSRVVNLAQREADIAIRNARPEHGDFVVRRMGELGSALYASKRYAKGKSPPATADDFRGLRIVGYPDRIAYLPQLRWLEEASGVCDGITRADDANALVAALKAGLGAGVVPCILASREPDLMRFGGEVARETIWIVSPAELASTRAVKVVLAFVASTFKSHAAALAG